MRIQPDSSKSASKQKRAPDVAAPRAQIKVMKRITRKVRKEAWLPFSDQGASNVNQVRIIPLELVFYTDIFWLNCSFLVCRPISWTFPAGKSRRAKKTRSWELQRIQRWQSIPWSTSRNRVAEPIRLNYSGSSALVITVQAILTQRTSNGTTH
jgi:hypothetical protein